MRLHYGSYRLVKIQRMDACNQAGSGVQLPAVHIPQANGECGLKVSLNMPVYRHLSLENAILRIHTYMTSKT